MCHTVRHVASIFVVYLIYLLNLIVMDTKIKSSIELDLGKVKKNESQIKNLKGIPKLKYL